MGAPFSKKRSFWGEKNRRRPLRTQVQGFWSQKVSSLLKKGQQNRNIPKCDISKTKNYKKTSKIQNLNFQTFKLLCWFLVHGPWSMDPGPWTVVHGPWSMDHRRWTMVHGPGSMDHGPWTIVPWESFGLLVQGKVQKTCTFAG